VVTDIWGGALVGGLGIKCRFNGRFVSSDRLYLCVSGCIDGDREEVERHLCADYSVLVTGGGCGSSVSTTCQRTYWLKGDCCRSTL